MPPAAAPSSAPANCGSTASLRLPDHAENLDARLILLRKRLDERGACIRIEKSGRGRFRLAVACGLSLVEVPDRSREPA